MDNDEKKKRNKTYNVGMKNVQTDNEESERIKIQKEKREICYSLCG